MSTDNSFIVSEKRRLIWQKELYLLKYVIKICKEHNLTYFASGGTLLGAIRHKGFIPWDDDIDISMPRDDYEKLLILAEKELPSDMFLQVFGSDQDYYFGHAKIRLNNSTAMKKVEVEQKFKYHQGVFIDVFPMDSVPDNTISKKIHKLVTMKLQMLFYYTIYYYTSVDHSKSEKIKADICRLLFPTSKSLDKLYGFYDRWVQKYNKKNTRNFGLISCFYHIEGDIWDKDIYKASIEVPFEDISIAVPIDYDKSLRKTFGDYNVPVRGGSLHGDLYVDLSNDYKRYLNDELVFNDSQLGDY